MNDKDLQQLLTDTAARLGVVGAQMAIYDGRQVREFVTGYRDLELGLPVTRDTLFQIGSTTKVFSASLVMSLVDAGQLDLDIPVHQYIHNFRLADAEAQQSITLRHLLSMTAGLDNGMYHDYGRGDDALSRYIDVLAGIPHIFKPGSAFGYSNASTNVACHAAARVMGRTWERLLTERILVPLGLQRAALFAEDLILHPFALGYEKAESGGQPKRTAVSCLSRAMGPAGGLTYCCAGDLVGLGRMFLDGGRSSEGREVLSAAAVETMHQPHIKLRTRLFADEWGVGPYRKQWGGHVLHGHSGSNYGGSSMLLWCPKKNIAIATVVNVSDQGYLLADAIFDEVFPKLFDIQKPAAPKPENFASVATDLRPYVGRFEAYGMTLNFAIEGDRLILTSTMDSGRVNRCELIPLGDDRFLPCDLGVSGNRNWDIAFWGRDAQDRAPYLLQGVFPLRRTS